MTHDEFNALAERLLHSLLQCPPHSNATLDDLAGRAISLAEHLTGQLNERRRVLTSCNEMLENEIAELVAGRKIVAVKMVRLRTGMSLRGSKVLVDRVEEGMRF